MSNDAGAPKKLSTKEILAAARAQANAAKGSGEAAGKVAEEEVAPAESSAPEAVETPAAEAPAAPVKKPSSTKDILAAARASAKGGAPTAKPGSTKDILAAARASAAGGGAPAAKPKSTADILAAARAAAGAKGAAASSAEPAAAKSAAAAKAPAAATGKKPSVQEMLAAVRGEQAGDDQKAEAAKPALPPTPVRPAPRPAKAGAKPVVTRRNVLVALLSSPFILAWVMFTGAAATAGLAVLRFMLPNVLTEPPSRFKVGTPGDFDLGTVSEKFKASNGIWIVHTDKYKGANLIYALASVCTHLGCTPSWLEGEQKFKCPCHGSGFYINGINFEGPAPRPLERVGIRLAEDGMLEVDKSLKFQEEMGQWSDPASYYAVS